VTVTGQTSFGAYLVRLPVTLAKIRVAITCHFVDDNFNLIEALLDFSEVDGQHTGIHLAEIVLKVLNEYDIVEKLYCITSDNASNNLTMVKELSRRMDDEHGIDWDYEKNHIPCLAHIINIAVDHFLKSIKADSLSSDQDGNTVSNEYKFSVSLKKTRGIAKAIRSSPQRWKAFQAICETYNIKPLKIYIDVPTRWNSVHRMLERVIYLRKAVHRFVEDHEELEEYALHDKEWDLMELLCGFLYPFKKCTDILQATLKPEIDRVFWCYNHLFNLIDDFKDTLRGRQARRQPWSSELLKALETMEEMLKKYYTQTEKPTVYVDAVILNPRVKLAMFKREEWSEEDAETYARQSKQRFEDMYDGLSIDAGYSQDSVLGRKRKADEIEDDDYEQFLNDQLEAESKNEFDKYLALPREPHMKCALDWWRLHWRQFPHLARMVRDVFSVPPTGSGVEREFSISGRVATWQRNRLHASTIRACMLYKNYLRRSNQQLEVCPELVECLGMGAHDDEEEETEEEQRLTEKTLADWRKDWCASLKRPRVTGRRVE